MRMTTAIRGQPPERAVVVEHRAIGIVAVSGDVRGESHRQLVRGALREVLAQARAAGRTEIQLDVADARYLDVRMLATLVVVGRESREAGLRLSLTGASDELVELLRTTKIDQVLHRFGGTITPRGAA